MWNIFRVNNKNTGTTSTTTKYFTSFSSVSIVDFERVNVSWEVSKAATCSVRKGVLRKFAKFTRKHLRQSLFFNKVAGLWPATLLKKRLWHRCFPVNFLKFLRTPFLTETSARCFWWLFDSVFISQVVFPRVSLWLYILNETIFPIIFPQVGN